MQTRGSRWSACVSTSTAHTTRASQLPVQQNAFGGFTLTLTENAGQCPGVLSSSSGVSGVEWCTIPYPGSTTRFQLFRYNASTLCGM